MLPIPELLRVARLLDDRWRCELAERAAARWAASDALFVRSSASHVFFARQSNVGARIVLRMRPESPSAYAVLHRSARAAEQLSAAGAPVVAAVRSSAGELVESVDGYFVTAVAAADGEVRDEEAADKSTATDWGAALAEVHAHGAAVDLTQLPDMVELCAPQDATHAPGQPTDWRLIAVADEVAANLSALPRDPAIYGLLHGDAELDNVVFTARGPVLVDLDDVRTGWLAADVGFALRSWAPSAAAPDLAAEVPAAFIGGYRSRRPMTEQELSRLPLFARAAALETLWELQPVLAHPVEPSWPEWATKLDARIRTRADELSAAILRDLDM
jgi:Ser/Thr protein kinase RdoA (MazF antagonist)